MNKKLFVNDDCLKVLKEMPNESIDLVVTDCPYKIVASGIKQNLKGNEPSGILNGRRFIADNSKLSQKWLPKNSLNTPSAVRQGKMFDNNDIEFEDWLPELYRVLKQNSHCYIMINGRNLKDLWQKAENVGFVWQNILVWDKGNATPNSYYMQSVEYILFLRKGNAKYINDMGSKTLISIPNIIGKKIHPTEKPIALFKHFVENSSNKGDLVLDPFAGSCPLAVACYETDRNFICIDIDKDFIKAGKERYNIKTAQRRLF